MKTKILKYYILSVFLVSVSCDDILDVDVRSSITGQNFWQSENDFTPFLIGIYARYRSIMSDMDFGEDRSEFWKQGYNARFTYWSQVIDAGNTRDWTGFYGMIDNCNLLLDRIDEFDFSNPATKDRIKAETYGLRAAMYFYMAKIWGDVPLVLTPTYSENEPLYARAPVSEVFAQINDDISQALALFPEDGYVDKYRLSKPAVYALQADVKMWTAKVLGGGNADLNAAISAITEVENSGVELLTTDYGDVFDDRKNSEIIFSLYLNRAEFTSGAYNAAFLRFDTSAGADNAEDLPIALAGQQGYALSPEAIALYKYPNDKRIPRSYVPEIYDGVVSLYWPNKFIGTKYPDDRIADSDIIIYRLSDMLLLKAEAYAALNQPTEALAYLNMVRKRAGIPDYTETDKALLEREILDERGRELLHELKRWWDLVRAHHSGVIDVYTYVPNLVGKDTPIYWPVHTRVLTLNEKLTQTEGY